MSSPGGCSPRSGSGNLALQHQLDTRPHRARPSLQPAFLPEPKWQRQEGPGAGVGGWRGLCNRLHLWMRTQNSWGPWTWPSGTEVTGTTGGEASTPSPEFLSLEHMHTTDRRTDTRVDTHATARTDPQAAISLQFPSQSVSTGPSTAPPCRDSGLEPPPDLSRSRPRVRVSARARV